MLSELSINYGYKTPYALAKVSGISINTIRRVWSLASGHLQSSVIIKLSKHFAITPYYFMQETNLIYKPNYLMLDDPTYKTEFRALRVQHGWSLTQLARRAGIGESTLAMWETSKRPLKPEVIARIMHIIGGTYASIFQWAKKAYPVIKIARIKIHSFAKFVCDDITGASFWDFVKGFDLGDPERRKNVKPRKPSTIRFRTVRGVFV